MGGQRKTGTQPWHGPGQWPFRPSHFIARALTLTSLLLAATAALAANTWYEDNNLGRAGGMPADFMEKFHRPEAFRQASQHIRVYLMRANVLNKLDDAFLTTLFTPYLRDHQIKLAINAGGATWAQAPGRARVFDMNMKLLQRLRRLGVEVHYISLQSVLSKPLIRGGKTLDYPLNKRIEDVVAYASTVRAIYPQAEIGIIDALPSHGKDYTGPYRDLRDAMSKNGLALSYIHVDMPFEYPYERRNSVTWQKLRQVERFVEEDLGLQFGVFTTSRTGGYASSKAFHDKVLAALECYVGATGSPRDFVIASWFPHPRLTIPDTATGTEYPAMRTVLEFGRRLGEMEKAGPAWAARRSRQSDWRALCTA